MALTADERRRGALYFARKHYLECKQIANLGLDAIEAAFEAAVNWFNGNETNSGTPRKVTLNTALPEPFKSVATNEQKGTIAAAAANFVAGNI